MPECRVMAEIHCEDGMACRLPLAFHRGCLTAPRSSCENIAISGLLSNGK